MHQGAASLKAWLFIFFVAGLKSIESARVFTIINDCETTIWPGITPGENFGAGGFELKSGESAVFTAPVGWSGRIWGRTGCNFNEFGNGTCQTGSCRDQLKCAFSGEPPATLAEFTLSTLDFYDVSLVDGFNLPLMIRALNGTGNCSSAGCTGDLRINCPPELSMKDNERTIGCKSACEVFGTDEYCCKGLHANPSTCQPTYYSKKFKEACPTAYSYAYDDPTSIFTCSGTDYVITFCSSRWSYIRRLSCRDGICNRTVCSYHDNKLACSSGSMGFQSTNQKWIIMIIIFLISVMWNIN